MSYEVDGYVHGYVGGAGYFVVVRGTAYVSGGKGDVGGEGLRKRVALARRGSSRVYGGAVKLTGYIEWRVGEERGGGKPFGVMVGCLCPDAKTPTAAFRSLFEFWGRLQEEGCFTAMVPDFMGYEKVPGAASVSREGFADLFRRRAEYESRFVSQAGAAGLESLVTELFVGDDLVSDAPAGQAAPILTGSPARTPAGQQRLVDRSCAAPKVRSRLSQVNGR